MTAKEKAGANRSLGKRGERLAADYLKAKGYTILAADFRLGRAQIDLIARRQDRLAFVEVKTRRDSPASRSEDCLSPHQTKTLRRALTVYAFKNHLPLEAVALDLIVIAADLVRGRARLRHYRDIL